MKTVYILFLYVGTLSSVPSFRILLFSSKSSLRNSSSSYSPLPPSLLSSLSLSLSSSSSSTTSSSRLSKSSIHDDSEDCEENKNNKYNNNNDDHDNNDNHNDDDNSNSNWDLMEDWMLQDRVPEFTVCGNSRSISRRRTAKPNNTIPTVVLSSSYYTFWRQLKGTVPELTTRTEFELEERYIQLAAVAAAAEQEATSLLSTTTDLSISSSTTVSKTSFIECGKSPEILTNWWIDDVVVNDNTNYDENDEVDDEFKDDLDRFGQFLAESIENLVWGDEDDDDDDDDNNTNGKVIMMNGRLLNGSSISFPLQSAGSVGGSSSSSTSSSTISTEVVDFMWLLEDNDTETDIDTDKNWNNGSSSSSTISANNRIKYVESVVDGCIYELGIPKSNAAAMMMMMLVSSSNSNNKEEEEETKKKNRLTYNLFQTSTTTSNNMGMIKTSLVVVITSLLFLLLWYSLHYTTGL